MIKYMVMYDHDPSSTRVIELAVISSGARPTPDQWAPAYRDTVRGTRVIWIRSSLLDADVWLRDGSGEAKAKRWRGDHA